MVAHVDGGYLSIERILVEVDSNGLKLAPGQYAARFTMEVDGAVGYVDVPLSCAKDALADAAMWSSDAADTASPIHFVRVTGP